MQNRERKIKQVEIVAKPSRVKRNENSGKKKWMNKSKNKNDVIDCIAMHVSLV